MSDIMTVFDRALVRRHRDRAAKSWDQHSFLIEETAERLADRLDDITRSFPLALELGAHTGELGRALQGRGGIETLIQSELSADLISRASGPRVVADEEAQPFKPGAFDLALSNLSLHWVNDLPGALLQARRALKDDGLLLGCMLGGETLRELRSALIEAEAEVEGGLSPRISPFAEVRDIGGLLQRAGFALPVVDADVITVRYQDPFRLLADLRGMAQTNALLDRRRAPLRRETLMAAMLKYREMFEGEDGRVPATFQVLFLTAWTPHPDQQQPMKPGAGQVSLTEALKDGGARETRH